MLSKIKAFLLVIEFVISTLITIVFMYLFKSKNHLVRKTWANFQTIIMNFTIKEIGEPDPEAKLVFVNHQSLVDMVALEAIHPNNLCWVAKKEITDIPLFGHIIKAPKMISIDRKDKRSIIKIIRESKERISEGRVIAMFPEGTRGRGEKLLKFQSGGKILAEKLELLVQPIVIVNSKYILDSQELTAHSGEVSVIYLDAIDPKENENWFIDLKDKMQRTLDDELANYTSNR
jgi:1-acyl-sn-glycerol-3-phosphate acyltransferase